MSTKRRKSLTSHTSEEIPTGKKILLYFYHELDEWQQDNHFIRSAYVKHTSSFWSCFKSLAYLHNESVNIYSHLIPAILTVLTSLFLFSLSSEDSQNPLWVRVSFVQFALGACTCLSSSALFHLFKSHSPKVCKVGNQCDYFGIVMMITSSLISIIMFVFDDLPRWRNSFIVLFMSFGLICTILTFDKKFATPIYRPFRSLMFILFGLSGLLPVIAASYNYGITNAIVRSSTKWLVLEGFFYIAGATLYAARIPERFYYKSDDSDKNVAGAFDIVGHSHQIFHVMVVIAALCHLKALLGCHMQWEIRNFEKLS